MSKKVERTQASTFDENLFEEITNDIAAFEGADSGVPENLDDVLLGQDANTNEEVQYQRGQEVSVMAASLGWTYVKESLWKMVDQYKKLHDAAIGDKAIIRTHREKKIAEDIVKRIIANVEVASLTPHPDEWPTD